jgi:hypothetical protein
VSAAPAAAVAWLDAHVARVGEVEVVRERPWATVLRAETAGGPVWMKLARAGTAFEVPLYELLARVAPEAVLTPIAVDVERSWLLLPDGGPSLGESEAGVDAVIDALAEYGRLQRALAPHVEEMLALGVHDMRPAAMPARFHEALASARRELPDVAALAPEVERWCERLAASPVPASLDHNDLHPWNILAGPRYYDWGDAVLAHAFAAMFVPLGYVQHVHGDEALARARDAYLRGFGDPAELGDTLELACQIAKIARALTWARAIEAGGDIDPEWADAPAESLERLLRRGYLD